MDQLPELVCGLSFPGSDLLEDVVGGTLTSVAQLDHETFEFGDDGGFRRFPELTDGLLDSACHSTSPVFEILCQGSDLTPESYHRLAQTGQEAAQTAPASEDLVLELLDSILELLKLFHLLLEPDHPPGQLGERIGAGPFSDVRRTDLGRRVAGC